MLIFCANASGHVQSKHIPMILLLLQSSPHLCICEPQLLINTTLKKTEEEEDEEEKEQKKKKNLPGGTAN